MRTLQNEGYNTAVKNQPIIINTGTDNLLACYGEKTIEGETYGKLLFFIDNRTYCLACTTDAGGKIESVQETVVTYDDADHDYRDAYRDVGSLSTSLNELKEAVNGLVPDTI